MDQSAGEQAVAAIATTIGAIGGVIGCHDLKTRKLGDMLVVDVHVDVAAELTVAAGHDITLAIQDQLRARHRVVGTMVHLDPWPRPEAHG